MILLPDTNACISFLRKRNQRLIARWRAFHPADFRLSAITIYELRYGAERSSNPAVEHAKLDAFFAPYRSIPFEDKAAERCASLRAHLEKLGHPIGPHDLQIAAIAIENGCTVVTHNTNEFQRVPNLPIVDWE